MSKRHRNRAHAPRQSVAIAERSEASASWGWRGGVSTSEGFDGAKVRGDLRHLYPSGYDLDSSALRSRSRVARWDSKEARAAVLRLADNVIGTGLTLRSSPVWSLIGSTLDEEGKRRQADEIDERFRLWADSHEPDATGRRNFAELQGFAFANELTDGDLPIVFRYSGDSSRMSPLSLQFLDADQIDMRQTTYVGGKSAGLALEAQARGNVLRDGLELTSAGEIVAIYVLDPAEPWGKPTRVPVKGASRRFVILPAILDLPGQVRGVGVLAPLVHEIEKLGDYELAEIQAAVSNALVAAVIQPGQSNDTRTRAANALGIKGAAAEDSGQVRVSAPGIIVDRLKAGETLQSYDTKRPNVNFGTFVDTVVKSLSASLSIPVEVLYESFNQNYSASRAALILFWETVERWRLHVVSQFLAPVYEAWLREEVRLGRFPVLVANGFGSDPVRTRAWLQADWIGDSMPSIDPLKEAQAVELRLAQGATTREREALRYNRSDYYDNAGRLTREAELLSPSPDAAQAARESIPPSDDPAQDQPAKEGAA